MTAEAAAAVVVFAAAGIVAVVAAVLVWILLTGFELGWGQQQPRPPMLDLRLEQQSAAV